VRARVVAPATTRRRDRVVLCDIFVSENNGYVLLCDNYMDCR
jgi:hypothetical protein